MSRKNKIIISISGIVIVLLLLLGLTYGFYLTRINGNSSDKSVTVSLANLELTYSDGNGLVESNNMIPGESITKTFTVENTGNKKVINYLIYLEDVVNTFEDKNDLKVTLTCTSNSGTCNGNTLTYPSSNTVIGVNDIEVKEKQEFSLKVEFLETNDNQDDNQNKKFSGNVKLKDMKSTSSEIVSNEGENILEINNAKAINHLLVYGNSTQEVRSGKNLIPYPYASDDGTYNGVSVSSAKDGKITLNGTATSSVNWSLINSVKRITLSPGTYTFSAKGNKTITSGINIWLRTDNDVTYNAVTGNKTITVSESSTWYVYFTVNSGTVIDNLTISIQLESGSTATDYEAYGATPSPDIPSEINSVGDLVTDTSDTNHGKYKIPVTVSSKNLWDRDIYVKSTSDNKTGYTVFLKEDYDWIKPNTTYTFSENVTIFADDTRTNPRTNIQFFYSDGSSSYSPYTNITKDGVKRRLSVTGTPTANKDITKIVVRLFDYGSNSGNIWHAEAENIQLEINSTATDYVPYKKETTNIYLDEPIRKIGDKSDYIDLKNGKVVRNIKNMSLVGTENYGNIKDGNMNEFYLSLQNTLTAVSDTLVMSNYFKGTNRNSVNKGMGGVSVSSNYLRITQSVDSKFNYDIATFKKWLKEKSTEGKPVIINYVVENPVEETVSIPSILTNESTKTIEIGTSTKPSKTQIEYIK